MSLRVEDRLLGTFNDLRGPLAGTLVYLLGNPADAQDVLQTAFVKCWAARGELVSVGNLRAWIWRVALNAAKDLRRSSWWRRARSLDRLRQAPFCPDTSPPDAAAHRERRAQLEAAIQKLGIAEREIFLLRQNGDLTYEEIAKLLSKPVGTVKTQMRAAVRKLRATLHDTEAACGCAPGPPPGRKKGTPATTTSGAAARGPRRRSGSATGATPSSKPPSTAERT
jgi:RNA polymerase sigma-70 factor (ECF subfamily)